MNQPTKDQFHVITENIRLKLDDIALLLNNAADATTDENNLLRIDPNQLRGVASTLIDQKLLLADIDTKIDEQPE